MGCSGQGWERAIKAEGEGRVLRRDRKNTHKRRCRLCTKVYCSIAHPRGGPEGEPDCLSAGHRPGGSGSAWEPVPASASPSPPETWERRAESCWGSRSEAFSRGQRPLSAAAPATSASVGRGELRAPPLPGAAGSRGL